MHADVRSQPAERVALVIADHAHESFDAVVRVQVFLGGRRGRADHGAHRALPAVGHGGLTLMILVDGDLHQQKQRFLPIFVPKNDPPAHPTIRDRPNPCLTLPFINLFVSHPPLACLLSVLLASTIHTLVHQTPFYFPVRRPTPLHHDPRGVVVVVSPHSCSKKLLQLDHISHTHKCPRTKDCTPLKVLFFFL